MKIQHEIAMHFRKCRRILCQKLLHFFEMWNGLKAIIDIKSGKKAKPSGLVQEVIDYNRQNELKIFSVYDSEFWESESWWPRGHKKPLPMSTYVYVVHIQWFILYLIFNYFLQESTCKIELLFPQNHSSTNTPVVAAKYFCNSLKCVSPFTICFFSNFSKHGNSWR